MQSLGGVTLQILESWDTSHRCLKAINQKTTERLLPTNTPCDAIRQMLQYIYHIVHLSVLSLGQTPLIETLLDTCLNSLAPITAPDT